MKRLLSPASRFGLVTLLCVAALAWGGYQFLWPAHGVRDVYVGRCNAHASVVVKSSAYSHPLDFKLGDATGYGLFLRISGHPNDIPLYNDGFSARDYPAGFPATYVGWDLAGEKWNKYAGSYVGPRPTGEFAPVPRTMPSSQVRVFELPSGSYSRDATPPASKTPLLMNIFIPADKISEPNFDLLAECLSRHRTDINRALARVRADFPYRSRWLYRPLRLGAVVRGLPPWSDPAYVDQVRSLYGDTKPEKALPEVGLFTLYKGQTASGVIDGRQVRVSILPTGQTHWVIDGTTFPDDPTSADLQKAGLRELVSVPNGLMIGRSICHVDMMDSCAKSIEAEFWNNDGSTQFWTRLKACGNAWVGDLAALAAWQCKERGK